MRFESNAAPLIFSEKEGPHQLDKDFIEKRLNTENIVHNHHLIQVVSYSQTVEEDTQSESSSFKRRSRRPRASLGQGDEDLEESAIRALESQSASNSELGLRNAGILNIKTSHSLPWGGSGSEWPQGKVAKKYRTHFAALEPINMVCNHYVFQFKDFLISEHKDISRKYKTELQSYAQVQERFAARLEQLHVIDQKLDRLYEASQDEQPPQPGPRRMFERKSKARDSLAAARANPEKAELEKEKKTILGWLATTYIRKTSQLYSFECDVHQRFLKYLCNWITNTERMNKSYDSGQTVLVINENIEKCLVITQN